MLAAQTLDLTLVAIRGFQPRSTAFAALFYAAPTDVQLRVCLCPRKFTILMFHPPSTQKRESHEDAHHYRGLRLAHRGTCFGTVLQP